jgi:sulfatase maturation enzyme AslB (radical SAM superfamily)
MHTEDYKNQMNSNLPFYDLYEKDYMKRLEFARDNGCNTVMLTGNSEPQQNRNFLQMFGTMNNNLSKPFRWIEMQTTGVMLDDSYLRFLRNHVRVSTISVSINSFDDTINKSYINANTALYKPIMELCESIKKYDFNLRLSINLTDSFNEFDADDFFYYANSVGADQVTFRVLYSSNGKSAQDLWIKEHSVDAKIIDEIKGYIKNNGRALERLEFGAMKYSIGEMSVVLDDDCMSVKESDAMKYLILRENCKLYSKWDDKGSLIF